MSEAVAHTNEVSRLKKKVRDTEFENDEIKKEMAILQSRFEKEVKDKQKIYDEMVMMRTLQLHISHSLDDPSDSVNIKNKKLIGHEKVHPQLASNSEFLTLSKASIENKNKAAKNQIKETKIYADHKQKRKSEQQVQGKNYEDDSDLGIKENEERQQDYFTEQNIHDESTDSQTKKSVSFSKNNLPQNDFDKYSDPKSFDTDNDSYRDRIDEEDIPFSGFEDLKRIESVEELNNSPNIDIKISSEQMDSNKEMEKLLDPEKLVDISMEDNNKKKHATVRLYIKQ